jgi:hypothetical protein
MTVPMRNLGALTVKELEQRMASVLTHAHGELLNESEMRNFLRLKAELEKRATLRQSDTLSAGLRELG